MNGKSRNSSKRNASDKPLRPPSQFDASWCSERLRSLFAETLSEELCAEASELIRSRRVLDFIIQPGRVGAKVHDERSNSNRVQIFFKQLSDSEWNMIFEELAGQAYFIALMLSGHIPPRMEEIFTKCGAELIPESPDQVFVGFNAEQNAPMNAQIAAVLLKLFEKIENDPFSIFILRGRGREETILELRRRRSFLKKHSSLDNSLSYGQVSYEPAPPLVSTVDYFWSSGPELKKLSYTIKADELPASILRWLDPPPLGGLENEIDYLLEEAYDKITRLAQGFGLQL